MKLYYEIYDLAHFSPWSGATDTYDKIIEAGKEEEFIQRLDDIYPDGLTESQLNDLLWFEEEWCYELVGLNKCGVEPIKADEFIGESEQIQDAIDEAIEEYLEEHDDCTADDFEDLDAWHFEGEIDDWLEDNQEDETDYDTLAAKWLDDVGREHIKDAVEHWFEN